MKTSATCLLLSAVCLFTAKAAKPLDVVGEDDASKSEYGDSWNADQNGGAGFVHWTLQSATKTGVEHSHAGFYIASTDAKPDLQGAAMRGKAFGMYANGTGFEVAEAFRSFEHPLKVGQSFSFLMQHGEIVQKFDTDDSGGGSIGLTLRASTTSASADDYNKDARFEIGYYKSDGGYVVYDGDEKKKLDMPFTPGGLAVTFTLTGADTYNLEITTLADKKTTRLAGRKLGGTPGSPVAGFCIFDRNGETNDAYFNGFQILQAAP